MEKSVLSKIPEIKKITSLAERKKINVWLVGGALRDFYLAPKKELLDFDFCVEKNAASFAAAAAKTIKGTLVVLDQEAGTYRVAVTKNNKIYTYDFTRMRGKKIKDDLSSRDFTINTLALNLNKNEFLDFNQGLKDLKNKKIKALSEKALIEDPLRILRGFSFAAQCNFKIEKKTLNFFCIHKKKIKKVSSERISREIFKIFACPLSYKAIKKMDSFKVTEEIMPHVELMRKTGQGKYHHLNVWEHSVETLRQFEILYQKKLSHQKYAKVKSYLNRELAKGRKIIQVLKIACLLHDLGKPFAKKKEKKRTIFHGHEKISRQLCAKFALKWRLSKNEKQSLEKMVFWHLRPGYLADQIKPTPKAVYRFFRDTQEDGVSIILLSLADWRATCGPLTDTQKRKRHEKIMLELVENRLKQVNKKPLPKILDGYKLMEHFQISSGPLVGDILERIKELQSLGRVKSQAEAMLAAEKLLKKKLKSCPNRR